ncbi:hypothetical protein CEQ90_04345 [Lewinellaceae bacterium SD302]|nr:hypothetical protein CEQ90_04345 [Lewinellaceae bacterium SD302]
MTNGPLLTDQALVELLRTGEPQYQTLLFLRYGDFVLRRCKKMLGDDSLARDLSQDILLKIFLRINQLRTVDSLQAWVDAVARNHCLSYLRKSGRHRTEDINAHAADLLSPDEELRAERLQLSARIKKLRSTLRELGEEERQLLKWRYEDKLSIKEIAAKTGQGESAVKMRLARSRERLARKLGNPREEE